MTLQQAAEMMMCGTVLIRWGHDDRHRRNTLYHAQVNSGGKAVCGRNADDFAYLTYSISGLWRRVQENDDLCSECVRLLAEYDFSSGKEPSREKVSE